MKLPIATDFAPLRDDIVARLVGYQYEQATAEGMADAAIFAHVKSIRHRIETCAKLVEKLPTGAPRSEALAIYLALEREALQRHNTALMGETTQ